MRKKAVHLDIVATCRRALGVVDDLNHHTAHTARNYLRVNKITVLRSCDTVSVGPTPKVASGNKTLREVEIRRMCLSLR